MHALIKELVIKGVKHRSEVHFSQSQHLLERTEVARLRRRFTFVLQQAFFSRTRHHLCRQQVALESTQQLRSQCPVPVHTYRIEGQQERKRANGVGGRSRVGGGNGDGNGIGGRNGDVNDDGDLDGAGMRTRVEANKGTQYGNGDGSGDGARTGTGMGTRAQTQDGNGDRSGDEDDSSSGDGNDTRMGTGTGTWTG